MTYTRLFLLLVLVAVACIVGISAAVDPVEERVFTPDTVAPPVTTEVGTP